VHNNGCVPPLHNGIRAVLFCTAQLNSTDPLAALSLLEHRWKSRRQREFISMSAFMATFT